MRASYEAYLSTEKASQAADARIFETDEHSAGPSSHSGPAQTRAEKVVRVMKIASLKGKTSFAAVYRRGRILRTVFFRLYILNSGGDATRAGIAVTRRACNAVKRNLIRRRIRHILSSLAPESIAGFDMVFYVDRDISGISFEELKAEILRALST